MDQAARLRNLTSRTAGEGARTITIASGKGGVGKTNVAVNLGLILARRGQRTLIFDADLGLANVDILMGMVPRYSILDVVTGRRELDEVIIRGPDNLLVLPGVSGIHKLAELDTISRHNLLNKLSVLAADLDVILVDSGAGISSTVFYFAAACKEAIVVATPEPTSIADAYCLIKGLNRLGVGMHLLINRSGSKAEGEYAVERLKGACSRFLQLDLPLLGIIPDDPSVGRAVRWQQPYSTLYPYCQATIALEGAADILQGQELPRVKNKAFWQRLNRLLGR